MQEAHPDPYGSAIRQIIRQELNRHHERVVFVIVFIVGIGLLTASAFVLDGYWQSLLLNIGSNFVVFVFLFWVFQYFTGKQPGSDQDAAPPELYHILDHISDAPRDPYLPSTSTASSPRLSRASRRGPPLTGRDQADISPDDAE